jgi:O-methyltransferase involved in polyketide biosynthesis
MDEERPSLTAEGAAVVRAIHQAFDREPKILGDPISVHFVDEQGDIYKSTLEELTWSK